MRFQIIRIRGSNWSNHTHSVKWNHKNQPIPRFIVIFFLPFVYFMLGAVMMMLLFRNICTFYMEILSWSNKHTKVPKKCWRPLAYWAHLQRASQFIVWLKIPQNFPNKTSLLSLVFDVHNIRVIFSLVTHINIVMCLILALAHTYQLYHVHEYISISFHSNTHIGT